MSDIEMVNDIQGWCPECGGTGMVMRGKPDDCPNLALHRFLDALTREKVAPLRQLDLALHGVAATKGEYEESAEVIWWGLLLEVRELVKGAKS